MNYRIVALTGLAALLLAIGPSAAQSHPATYGGTVQSVVTVPANQFTPLDSTTTYNDRANDGLVISRYPTGGNGSFYAGVSAPGGALLTLVEFDYCDTSATGHHAQLKVVDCNWMGSNCTQVVPTMFSISGGCGYFQPDLTGVNYQFDNMNRRLYLVASTDVFDGTNSISGVIVGYKLQVSPAPATASFVDVPTSSPIFKFVEALKASGITAGCDATHYCPNASLTRGQMAVFLAAALGLEFP